MESSTMDSTSGGVIAFEGHQDVISTQLRLLPTSPQILILPGLESYLPFDTEQDNFDSRTYIHKLHEAAKTRNEAAHQFLQESTASSKRLVFMNGGTSHAHALCIKAIMEHETNGDAIEAESIFRDLVKEGIVRLDNAQTKIPRRATFTSFLDEPENYSRLDDPVTRAMRAADALDRLTASLQPSNELDLTAASRPRSTSLPLYGYSDDFQDSAPFFVFGARDDQEDCHAFLDDACQDSQPSASRNVLTQYEQLLQLYENPSGSSHLPPLSPQSPTSCISESCIGSPVEASSPSLNTPWSDIYSPFSPRASQNVIYGEASLVDVRASSRKVVRRIKSLDRVYATSPRFRDLCFPLESPQVGVENTTRWRPSSCMVEPNHRDSWNSEPSCIDGPRTIFVKPKRPTISIDPVPNDKKRKQSQTSNSSSQASAATTLKPAPVAEPLLPFTETLVIYFKDDVPDVLLESVIDSFKDGTHACSLSVGSDVGEVNDGSLPQTPQSPQMFQGYRLSVVCEEPSSATASNDDEYDPFAYTHPDWPQPKSPRKAKAINVDRPPTPARTPTPSMSDQKECFHDFNITAQQTAVTIQNTLRSILNVYYPPESQSYRQFQSLLPETEGIWNPLLGDAEPSSPQRNKWKMDQIVAIGAQRDVSKAFTSRVTGQLEKLGTAANGVSRSGRLDFRYLLANAMQAFTAQPLANQTCDNPFNNPYLLATLIVPHLETYLVLHSESRYLLLEYPQEHLATVLALQKLVGVDLMKVAQIVDANSNEHLPFTHIRGASISKNTDCSTPPRTHKRSPSSPKSVSSDVTFTKANFLLTSTASEPEIDTFIDTILKILVDVSPFYKPEEVKKPSSPKPRALGLKMALSPYPKIHSTSIAPVTSVRDMTPPQSLSPTSLRRSSFGETVSSSRAGSRPTTRRHRNLSGADYVSTYTLDFAVDHDLRMEERRLMPMYMHKPNPSEGNSQKALKFLGLA